MGVGAPGTAIGESCEHWSILLWRSSYISRPWGDVITYAASYFRQSLKSLRTQVSLCLPRSPRRPVRKTDAGDSTVEGCICHFGQEEGEVGWGALVLEGQVRDPGGEGPGLV